MSIVVALVAGFVGSMVAGLVAYLYVRRRAGAKLASLLGMSPEEYAALKAEVLAIPKPREPDVNACCVDTYEAIRRDAPPLAVGYRWICGGCSQWWEMTRTDRAERIPAPRSE